MLRNALEARVGVRGSRHLLVAAIAALHVLAGAAVAFYLLG